MAECGLCVNREERALIRSSSSGSLTATGEQHTPFTHTHVHDPFKFANQMNAHVCGNVGGNRRTRPKWAWREQELELNHQTYCYGGNGG